ncbi:MAG: 3-dehydroquinate synthase [Ferruginibacter sp.]
MKEQIFNFRQQGVKVYFNLSFAELSTIANISKIVIVTDENIFALHKNKFEGIACIVVKAGEQYKQQATVDFIIAELLKLGADKQTVLLGVGGGVVTDITGYAASIYKRGIGLALVPTSILAMVDAAIGGKNGVDAGIYKNMVGTVYQPSFVLYDYDFLKTLPGNEWVNGFAEIIKHACIKDAALFGVLENYLLKDFQNDAELTAALIEKNVLLKMDVVTNDEFERGDRKLLNFGHTIGHAIENLHKLPHGHAVSIGMIAACNLSEKINNFHFDDAGRVVKLLASYNLPVDIETDYDKVFDVLKLDKKVKGNSVDFILLDSIGKAIIKPIPLENLKQHFKAIL